MKSCIFNCDQVSNKSKEIVGNAYKGDHNNYFAAESLRMGERRRGSTSLSAKQIDVGAQRATLQYTYVLGKRLREMELLTVGSVPSGLDKHMRYLDTYAQIPASSKRECACVCMRVIMSPFFEPFGKPKRRDGERYRSHCCCTFVR